MHIKLINTVLERLGRLPAPVLSALAVLLVLLAGALDLLTGYEWYVSLLYLLPILLLAWFSEGISVALISIACAVTWFAADLFSGRVVSHLALPLMAFLAVLSMFLIVGYYLAYMKKIIKRKHEEK